MIVERYYDDEEKKLVDRLLELYWLSDRDPAVLQLLAKRYAQEVNPTFLLSSLSENERANFINATREKSTD